MRDFVVIWFSFPGKVNKLLLLAQSIWKLDCYIVIPNCISCEALYRFYQYSPSENVDLKFKFKENSDSPLGVAFKGTRLGQVDTANLKLLLREFTGFNFIHCADSDLEIEQNVRVLNSYLGSFITVTPDAFLTYMPLTRSIELNSLIPFNGLEELRSVMRKENEQLVVLREDQGDIDLLVSDKQVFIKLTGAIPLTDDLRRAQYIIGLGGNLQRVDIRECSDNYFPPTLAQDILRDPKQYVNIGLIYHIRYHKVELAAKYASHLNLVFGGAREAFSALNEYLVLRDVSPTRPLDPSVRFFNTLFERYMRRLSRNIRMALKAII